MENYPLFGAQLEATTFELRVRLILTGHQFDPDKNGACMASAV